MDITVVGRARASFAPERATLHLTLGHEGGDKEQVLRATTELAQRFAAHVDELRHREPSPTTWSALLAVRTRSWRPWSDQGQVLPMRHAAACEAQVKYRDFQALAATVDAWGGQGGVTVGRVEWALTEATRERRQVEVLQRAVADARSRALTIAQAAGHTDVQWLEVADPGLLPGGGRSAGGPELSPMAMRAGATAGGREGVDLAPEDIAWEVEVHARFTTL